MYQNRILINDLLFFKADAWKYFIIVPNSISLNYEIFKLHFLSLETLNYNKSTVKFSNISFTTLKYILSQMLPVKTSICHPSELNEYFFTIYIQ